MLRWSELCEFADLQESMGGGPEETATPIRLVSVIAIGADGKRKAVRMRWGLVPPGAKDPTAVKPHIHARAETIDTKPTFREAFAKRRGLVVVNSFNEGLEITPTKTEQYVLTPKDGAPIAIAVVWEHWREPLGGSLLSFAMVTVPPNALIATITDRMPALIEPKDWPLWLGETKADLADAKALLKSSARDLDMQRAKKPPSRTQPDLF
ncbi:putative SOS response-associated peptidase YedK [Rhizomicrobium palustre]|uniref:Abasic site processing protein n=2 Tax=Rhizomicrobium palustre TaxID=189966 RepID=A0A846MUE8_9PROT|nr:putative SOS response-associated peptidase YedK [Rhizomicrobium palustre]